MNPVAKDNAAMFLKPYAIIFAAFSSISGCWDFYIWITWGAPITNNIIFFNTYIKKKNETKGK